MPGERASSVGCTATMMKDLLVIDKHCIVHEL